MLESKSAAGLNPPLHIAQRPELAVPRPLGEDGWPNFLKTADRWILRILGIVPPKHLPHGEEVCVGQGIVPGSGGSTVTLYVSAFPARHWRVVIDVKGHAAVELKAGSTDLQKLWMTIELIAKGVLEVRVLWSASGMEPLASSDLDLEGERTAVETGLPVASFGQGSFAHDQDGNATDLEAHSPTQSEISAARFGGAA